MSRSIEFLDVRVDDVQPAEVLQAIEDHVLQRRTLTIGALGANTAVIMQHDPGLRHSLNTMSIVCPDGVSMLWASRLLGQPLSERVTGDILAPNLFQIAIQRGFKLYFLGGRPGVAQAAAAMLPEVHTGLTIVGTHHGYFPNEQNPRLVAEINASGADIVLVGMGVPIQEKWVAKYANQVSAPVLITVGGYFDHVLRRIDCYPAWVHRHRLNWLYRLVKEPRRLWWRYLLGGLEFCFLVARLKWKRLNRNEKGGTTAGTAAGK